MKYLFFLFFLVLAVARETTSQSSGLVECRAPHLKIVSADAASANRACDAIAAQSTLFDTCGLTPTRAHTMHIVERIEGAPGDCLGAYHCTEGSMEIIGPDWISERIQDGSVLARLDPDELYASIVVHEWTHALLFDVTGNEVRHVADQEYVAFAMQISSLPEAEREKWLSYYASSGPVEDEHINDMILAVNPLIFATRAWRHFSAEDDACSTVRAIVAGDHTFRLDRY